MAEPKDLKFVTMAEAVAEFEKRFDQETEDDFFPTAFPSHNSALGDPKRGQLILVGARPSIGKTAWMLSCAYDQLKIGIQVYFFTLEMPRVDMIARLVSIETGIRLLDIMQRRTSDAQAREIVGALPSIVPLPAGWSEESNSQQMGKLFDQIKPRTRSIVYVDFLGLVEVTGLGPADSYAATTQIGLSLKHAAMQLGIPIVAAVQLNRQIELRKEKQPLLSDFRDSGRLEEIGDLCLGLHRPGFNDPNVPDDELQVFCLKNRNGPRVNYVLGWDGPCARAREKTKMS